MKTGQDDHLTVVLNGNQIDQAHRKVDGREVWHHTGEHLQAELDTLLANATTVVDPNEFKRPNTYIVSARRAKVLFSLVTLPFTVFFHFFWRLFATAEISKSKNGVLEARIVLEERKTRHLLRSSQRPALWMSRLLRRVPPKAIQYLIKFVGKRVLVDPRNIKRLEEDLWFVVSNDRIGFASLGDDGKVRFVSAAPLFDALFKLKSNVPVSFDDIGNFSPGTELRMKTTLDRSGPL